MNHVGTHPEITKTEILGSPVNEPERIQCPTCEKMVLADDFKYCEYPGCKNKRHCLEGYNDPVKPSETYMVCEDCAEIILDIFDAKNKRHDYNVLVATAKAVIENFPEPEGKGMLIGILRHQGQID